MKERGLRDKLLRNIPNALTISRIILTPVIIYLILTNRSMNHIIILFSIAAITDFLDGQLARRFGWISEFGRKMDVIADRFLWIGTALAFFIFLNVHKGLNLLHMGLLLLIFLRELSAAPFAIYALFYGNPIPKVNLLAKAVTFVQGFALPSLILSSFYPKFLVVTIPLVAACSIMGIISTLNYIKKSCKKKKA